MLYVLVRLSGTVVQKRAEETTLPILQRKLAEEQIANPNLSFEIFSDSNDPLFKNVSLPDSIPSIQDQLNAIWRDGPLGGTEMETMRQKVLRIIGPIQPISPSKTENVVDPTKP